jgi:hypothetical protein
MRRGTKEGAVVNLSQHWQRRDFVRGLAIGGALGVLPRPTRSAATEPDPETTRIRVIHPRSVCSAPMAVA